MSAWAPSRTLGAVACIYVLIAGQQSGPFTAEELSALWEAGEIPADAGYWYEGMPDWAPVAEFQPPPAALSRTITCNDCGGVVSMRAAACPHCGGPVESATAAPATRPLPREFVHGQIAPEEPVRCPKCRSAQVSSHARGWSVATGLIGSGQVVLTCLKCGNRFKPGR